MSNIFLTRTNGISQLNLEVLNKRKPQVEQNLPQQLTELLSQLEKAPEPCQKCDDVPCTC